MTFGAHAASAFFAAPLIAGFLLRLGRGKRLAGVGRGGGSAGVSGAVTSGLSDISVGVGRCPLCPCVPGMIACADCAEIRRGGGEGTRDTGASYPGRPLNSVAAAGVMWLTEQHPIARKMIAKDLGVDA